MANFESDTKAEKKELVVIILLQARHLARKTPVNDEPVAPIAPVALFWRRAFH